MSASAGASAGTVRRPAAQQPPWLVVHAALAAVLVLPGQWSMLQQDWAGIQAARGDVAGVETYRFFLLALAVAPASLAVGLALVAFPSLRRRFVERARRPIVPGGDAQAEMQRFVDRHATMIDLRMTAGGSGLARIYPLGFRRARIAVFPAFLRLWESDRTAAEATLLHEIAHHRQGEHLVAGLAGPFHWLVRIWGFTFVTCSLLPVVVLTLQDSWGQHLLATAARPELVQDGAQLVRLLLFPVAALWLAELAADDWAARTAGAGPVLAALSVPGRGRLWTRAFRLLDHPPTALRRHLVRRQGSGAGLLLCWPAVPVAAHFLVSAVALTLSYPLMWNTTEGLPARLVEGSVTTLSSSLPLTVTSLVAFLAWPWVSRRWPGLWTSGAGGAARPWVVSPPRLRPFVLAAVLPALMILGSRLPAPATEIPDVPQAVVGTSVPDGLGPGPLPVVLEVTRVTTFEPVGVSPERAAAAREGLLSSRFTFDEDGLFEADGIGPPSGPQPVRGRWLSSPFRLTFTTDLMTGDPTTPTVSMTGSVDTTGHPLTLELLWSSATSFEIYRITAEVTRRD